MTVSLLKRRPSGNVLVLYIEFGETNNNVNKALLLNHLKFTELYIYKLTGS